MPKSGATVLMKPRQCLTKTFKSLRPKGPIFITEDNQDASEGIEPKPSRKGSPSSNNLQETTNKATCPPTMGPKAQGNCKHPSNNGHDDDPFIMKHDHIRATVIPVANLDEILRSQ